MSQTAVTSSTGTTAGAREHARAQEATFVRTAPTRPPSNHADQPDGISPEDLVWAELVAGGNYSHKVLARGTSVQLTDVDGDACAHVLLYNALQTHERLNVADTVKVQWQVYAATGQLLLSDQGRVLASLTEDTSHHHDTIYGTSTKARNSERYGDGEAFGPAPAGRELFVLAGAKHGLGRGDIPPSVSFFKGVRIDGFGRPRFDGSAAAGSSVTLRAELPVIILVANTAHPLDPRTEFRCSPLEILAWKGAPTSPGDPAWERSPEGRRAFVNACDYLTAQGIS